MFFFRSINGLFLLQATVLLLFIVATQLRIIQLNYPRVVENQPLLSPLRVLAVSGNTLTLYDGRTYQIGTLDEPLTQVIQESDWQVDIETDTDKNHSTIYVKHRGWICGNPWLGLIQIPLIADDIPINRREPLSSVKLVTAWDTSDVTLSDAVQAD